MSQFVVLPMPAHGDCGALQFNPTKLHKLHHFFEDLKFQFVQSHVVDKEKMKGHALYFVDCDTTETKFADVTTSYQMFIDAMYKLYPGSDMEQCWLIVDMNKLVGDTSRIGISLLTD